MSGAGDKEVSVTVSATDSAPGTLTDSATSPAAGFRESAVASAVTSTSPGEATATAHANIALIKYWGKANDELIIPRTSSLSLTLDELYTTTTVRFLSGDETGLDASIGGKAAVVATNRQDRATLDGKPVSLYTLNSGKGLIVQVTNFGLRIVSIWTPDKNGKYEYKR